MDISGNIEKLSAKAEYCTLDIYLIAIEKSLFTLDWLNGFIDFIY
jgi:hypothetical protein